MILDLVMIVVGIAILIFGGNWLLKAAVNLSTKFGISKIVIGLTVVSFATSAPELIVSLNAALKGSSSIALGNVIGSNIANLGLVLGVTLFFTTMRVSRTFYRSDWPMMMLASVVLYLFLIFDSTLSRWEGMVLFALLIIFLVYLLKIQNKQHVVEDEEIMDKPLPAWKTGLFLVLGGIALWGGSELLVSGAESLARAAGVGERVIAITLVSVGTSIPELAASIIAAINKEKAISLGNLIGSNIFNICSVLGLTAIIQPISVDDPSFLNQDVYWMLGFSALIFPLVFAPIFMRLSKWEGTVLLLSYVGFLCFIFG